MIGARLIRSSVLGMIAAGLLAVVTGVAPACAEAASPWWGVSSSTRPASLQAGTGRDEVQEITIANNSVVELMVNGKEVGELGTGSGVTVLKLPEANAANVQKALESASAYGEGNVTVTGGPGATSPLVVTSVGEDAGRPVHVVEAHAVIGSASVKLTREGQADGQIVVMVENLGDGEANGAKEPVQILDTLPNGLRAVAVEELVGHQLEGLSDPESSLASCSPASASPLTCTFTGVVAPYHASEVRISVNVEPGASSGENTVSVSGGGATASRTVSRPVQIGGQPRFGVQENLFVPEEVGGAVDTRAGSHPFQLTSVVTFNQTAEGQPVALPKDVGVLAPPGLVGNPTPFAQCTDQQFSTLVPVEGKEQPLCSSSTAIGVATISFNLENHVRLSVAPVFNMVPGAGEPARFGFYAGSLVPVTLNTSVRTGGDYGVTVSSHNIIELAGLLSAKITLWGVPGDPRHDAQRGYVCLDSASSCNAEREEAESGELQSTPPPFLSLPTSCTGPLQASALVDSWAQPQEVLPVSLSEPMLGQDGCNHLPFAPEISVAPDVSDASTPTGLTVDVHVPQTAALNPEGLAESTLRNTTVVLPEGVTVTPGGADGLEACSEKQVGFEGQEPGGAMLFTPGLPSCPSASKIATVKITTPLLPNPLKGEVYLATPAPNGEPGTNPFDSLIAMYLVAEDPVSGVLVKLPGKVVPNQVTGQLTSTFEDTPQLPFEELELHFFGGARAPLATPSLCGSYTTQASFAPWSGSAPVQSESSFQVTSGPNGSGCESPLPFDPEFETGTTNIQAGAFSELRTTMGHPDADQTLGGLSMTLPPGLMGSLADVKLCGEAEANAGTCGPESLIGHTVVTAGLGSEPVVVKRPGDVYITGPYRGAPFGLSIVNPAEAGPFNLGNVVVRAKIEVDPHTAQLSIVSDPLPTILDGIPLQIQHVAVTIERPGFTFNPTSCSKMKIEGAMSSSQGATAAVSSPFQATNCASLPFKPRFTASTSARTSRADGASLTVRLTSKGGPGASGGEANIHRAKVELPKILPSRLSTLQKACTEAQFNANPAGCPAESIVGHAVAHTPILNNPLEGPAYFVSHGGAKFPELIMVLQGEGITIDLAGETFISKKGVTSTTLSSVPDAPVSTFELTLPMGKDSALAANGNLCAQKLVMPTEFVGQNGAQRSQQTPIDVEGCSKALRIASRSVKGREVTVKVYAPAAGKVKVSGKGLTSQSRTARSHETLKFTVKQKQAGKLATRLQASFTPKAGRTRKRQNESVKLKFGK